jgi:cyclopropane fatty-acyl-phospholipid synthase-like methyltransferase
MKDWKNHWGSFPSHIDETKFLEQVGKTVNKRPISKKQFDVIVSSIISGLMVHGDDTVLDLCCGNGIVTKAIAGHCNSMVGLDFSSRLLEIAVKYHSAENIEYILADAMDASRHLGGREFRGVYMYEALQHFGTVQLQALLCGLRALMPDGFAFFIGSIPDSSKKWKFYDTLGRKLSYAWRKINNDEAIGTWWDRDFIRKVCSNNGLEVTFIEQNAMLHTAHYRFDAYIHG